MTVRLAMELATIPVVAAFLQAATENVSYSEIVRNLVINILTVVGTVALFWRYLKKAFDAVKKLDVAVPKIISLVDSFTDEDGKMILKETIDSIANDVATVKAQNEILFESTNTPIFLMDEKGGCVYVNSAWTGVTGLTQREAEGNGWQVAINFADKQRVMADWDSLIKYDRPFLAEFSFVNQLTSVVYFVRARAVSVKNKKRVIIAFIGQIKTIRTGEDVA